MVFTHPVKETSRRNELIESGKKRLYKSKSYFIRIELIAHFAKLKDVYIYIYIYNHRIGRLYK